MKNFAESLQAKVQQQPKIPSFSGGDLEPLKKLFKKSDTTSDGYLTLNELSFSIGRSVEKHLQGAMRNNFRHFFKLDVVNHNGQVEWNEWLASFYKKHGLASDEDVKSAPRKVKEKLAAAKAAWSEAARSNPDALNIDEFLSFTHPESSHSILATQTEELFGRYDADENNVITLNEYLDDPFLDFTDDEKKERTKEFTEDIDTDGNGQADRREILQYFDPKHPSHQKHEAERLLELADENEDGLLEWKEMEKWASEFLTSRLLPERAFHTDL